MRRDRNRRGGAVMAYVSELLKARREYLEDDVTETLWIEVRAKNNFMVITSDLQCVSSTGCSISVDR